METKKELTLTRLINAPRELVFKAWTDEKQLAQWWGPEGFTNPVCKLELNVGGPMRIDMKGPDGTVYPMTGVFKEIIEPERLVFSSAALDTEGKPLLSVMNTVTFENMNGKTKLSIHAAVLHATQGATPYIDGMDEGWKQTLDKLERFSQKIKV